MKLRLLTVATIVVLGGMSVAQADVVAVTSFSGGSNFPAFNGTNQTIGWSFTANADLFVTSLGFNDATPADDLSQSHQVGLWTSTGDLLASVTVQTNSAILNGFRYEGIGAVQLTSGSSYLIGAAITSPFNDIYTVPGSVTTSSLITLTGSARNASSGGFSAPTTVTAGNGRIGPNFQFSETTSAPEPTSLALIATGVLCLGLARRRPV